METPTQEQPRTAQREKRTGRRRGRVPGLAKALVVLALLGASAGGFLYWRDQQDGASSATTIRVPVMQGNLDVSVESSGKVEAGKSSLLKFEAKGQVIEVLVKPGDKVTAGQPLVRLDDDDLRLKVEEAEASLKSAQAKLNDLKKGSSASEIASAQADLQSAKANLAGTKSGATAKELADAQAELKLAQVKLDSVQAGATAKELSDAEAELRGAQATLENLKSPAASSETAAAESDLKAAKLKLSELKAGATDVELSDAQFKVAQAEAAVNRTRSSSNLAKQEAEIAFQKADRALREAQRVYDRMAAKALDENGLLHEEVPDDLQGEYRSIEDLVDAYYEALYALQDAQGDYHKAQFTLDDVRQSEIQDVAEAEAKLANAGKALQDLQAGPSDSKLAEAQLAVDKAQKALDELKTGATEDKLADAEAEVVKAQTKLDQLKAGPTKDELAEAQTTAEKAQNKLDNLKAGPTQAKIAEAQALVAQKEAALQKLKEPPAETDMASAEEAVVKAQANLKEAKTELGKATIAAPFSGTVAEVDAETNSMVAIGDQAVTIYDQQGMHLKLEVSESDIDRLKTGQYSDITIDALPDKTLTGTVTSISAVATSGQDVVTYNVEVQFDPGALPLKLGMSANAAVRVDSRKNAIQVPNRAIKSQGPFKTVQVLYGEQETPVTVRVQAGVTDGQMTEIVSCLDTGSQCLRSGDQVSITMSSSTQTGGPGGDVIFFGGTGGPPPGAGRGTRFQAPAGGP